MKEAVVLMRFLRQDPIGRRFGVVALVVAWFALAWMSVAAVLVLPLLLIVSEIVRRRREDMIIVDDLEDLY
ncbi:MAG: hypothetical protein H0W90_14430 [Actinobacteria bacterium]|nr:hypothetical protein [Actinomycetota bacterium]